MKKILHILAMPVLLAVLAAGVAGCSADDGYSLDKFWISYGTVTASATVNDDDSQTMILRDDGARLVVTANMIPQVQLKVGDRVLVHYTILEDIPVFGGRPAYNIRLNTVQHLLCKGTIKESFILRNEAFRNDSIGMDPVNVAYAWFGGDYLNIRFGMMRQTASVVHYISLVHDDTNPDTQNAYLTLRHNAHGDQASYMAFGYVSFNIRDLVPQNADKIGVRLFWRDYDGRDYECYGDFVARAADAQVVYGNDPGDYYDYTNAE